MADNFEQDQKAEIVVMSLLKNEGSQGHVQASFTYILRTRSYHSKDWRLNRQLESSLS
jgi:hypothetical protein